MSDHQYSLPDLRQLMAGRTHFQGNPQANAESFFLQSRNLAPQITQHHHYHNDSIMAAAAASEVMLPVSGLVKLGHDHYCANVTGFNPTTTTTTATTAASNATATFGTFFGVEMESGWIGNDAGNNSRWPRQETLTLLEIRSRLDSRFKEANQKGPLWDEVSRIMAEEHGYQRSGKKCREKFENLYKYYKKTKEGKAGRQDGKHYRFFRQLEALYGETSKQSASETTNHLANTNSTFLYQTQNNTINQENQESFQETKHSDQSLSFSNTSEFETSSSENNDDDLSAIAYMMNRSMDHKQKGLSTESQSCNGTRANNKMNWKCKVKDFVDVQMRKLMERQEAWMERMLKTIEDREQERMFREEEWTKQEAARLDRIHECWTKERAWIEARDVALMEVLRKCTGKEQELSASIEQIALATQSHYNNQDRKLDIDHEVLKGNRWSEPEIFILIQIRTTMESRFQESSSSSTSSSGYSKENLWEDIARKMASLGYDRGTNECKEKWENMNIYFNMATEGEGNKKRKEDLRTNNYFQQLDPYNGQDIAKLEGLNSSPSPTSNSYMGGPMHGSCFHQVPINGVGGGGQYLWNKYGLKLKKEKNQQL